MKSASRGEALRVACVYTRLAGFAFACATWMVLRHVLVPWRRHR